MTVMAIHPEELIPTERIGLVSYWLTRGESLTVDQVKQLTGFRRRQDAKALLERLARVLPIYQRDGCWEMCECAAMHLEMEL